MQTILSYPKLIKHVKKRFAKIPDLAKRARTISLADHLMSACALFLLKYPSLLKFDQDAHQSKLVKYNLKSVYHIKNVPSDTHMREILDSLDYKHLEPILKSLFACAGRSGKLSNLKYGDSYLVSLDGTKYFYSKKIYCDNCCIKKHRDGSTGYYHNMLVACIVHPKSKVVLPLGLEPIAKTDGSIKNDCEMNAAIRILTNIRRKHPHLKITITADGLFSNGTIVKLLKEKNYNYILVAKQSNSKALFKEFNASKQQNRLC